MKTTEISGESEGRASLLAKIEHHLGATSSNFNLLLIGLSAVAIISVGYFILPLGPILMQDEFVYSTAVLRGSDSDALFPNYLHTFLYSAVNQCGPWFYQCTKMLNLLFVALSSVTILWLASRVLPRGQALLAALLSFVAGATIFSSMFMPESLYFFLSLLAFVGAWKGLTDSRYLWLAASATALSALVKPHALILLASIVAAILLFPLLRGRSSAAFVRSLKSGLLVLTVFVTVRLSVGFLIAGPASLNVIGPAYGRFLERLFSISVTLEVPEILLASGEWAVASTPIATNLILVFISQLFVFFSFFALLFGVPITAVFARHGANDSQELPRHGIFTLSYLTLVSLLVFGVGIAMFAALLTATGDDHSIRFMTRYFEFLILLAPVFWLALLGGDQPKHFRKWLAVASSIGLISMLFAPQLENPGLIDSPAMYGFLLNEIWKWLLLTAIATGLLMITLGKYLRSGVLLVLVGISVVPTLLAFEALQDRAQSISEFGLFESGVSAEMAIPDDASVQIFAVSKKDAEFLAFGLRTENTKISVLGSDSRQIPDDSAADYVIALNSTFLQSGFEGVERVGLAMVYRMSSSTNFKFPGLPDEESLVTTISGGTYQGPQGSWVIDEALRLGLAPLKAGYALEISLFTMPGNDGFTSGSIRLCGTQIPIELPNENVIRTAVMPIGSDLDGCTELVIEAQEGTPIGVHKLSVTELE